MLCMASTCVLFFYVHTGVPMLLGAAAKSLCTSVFVEGATMNSVENSYIHHIIPKFLYNVEYLNHSVKTHRWLYTREAFFHGRFGCILDQPSFPVSTPDVEELSRPSNSFQKRVHYRSPNYAKKYTFTPPSHSLTHYMRIFNHSNQECLLEYGLPDRVTTGWSLTKTFFEFIFLDKVGHSNLYQSNLDSIENNQYIESYNLMGDTSTMQFGHNDIEHSLSFFSGPSKKKPTWRYSTLVFHNLSYQLQNHFPTKEAYLDYPFQAAQKMNITSLVFETDTKGVFLGGSGIHMKNRDWSRFADVLIRDWSKGRNGTLFRHFYTHPVNASIQGDRPAQTDRSWVLQPDVVENSHGMYKNTFWSATRESKQWCQSQSYDACYLIKALPLGSFWARGLGGQLIIYIPAWNISVVRLGDFRSALDKKELNKELNQMFQELYTTHNAHYLASAYDDYLNNLTTLSQAYQALFIVTLCVYISIAIKACTPLDIPEYAILFIQFVLYQYILDHSNAFSKTTDLTYYLNWVAYTLMCLSGIFGILPNSNRWTWHVFQTKTPCVCIFSLYIYTTTLYQNIHLSSTNIQALMAILLQYYLLEVRYPKILHKCR